MSIPRSVLLVRTFRPLGTGGPIPPTGLLYVAGALRRAFPELHIELVDMGLGPMSAAALGDLVQQRQPDLVGLSAMTCEAGLLHEVVAELNGRLPWVPVIVGGPHGSVAWPMVLEDPGVDLVVLGEAEDTVVELLPLIGQPDLLAAVAGIAFRDPQGVPTRSAERPPIADLDAAPEPAWDLVDLRAYRELPSWNGVRKEPFHAPVLTSRGCPYGCRFCHGLFGRQVRVRSPEHVLAELCLLYERDGVREFHIIDDIFNLDPDRAGRICDGIVAEGLDIAIAFPNGLRADILEPTLIEKLERAGTYKIHFGFESSSPRLQQLTGKGLDIPRALATISQVARTRILVGAYFMLGLPTETEEEARATIACAASSDLDAAYFFKTTLYPGTELGDEEGRDELSPAALADYHFFSSDRSNTIIPAPVLNGLLLEAQARFWLRPRRLWRSFRKAPRKLEHLRSLLAMAAMLLQAWMVIKLAEPPHGVDRG